MFEMMLTDWNDFVPSGRGLSILSKWLDSVNGAKYNARCPMYNRFWNDENCLSTSGTA